MAHFTKEYLPKYQLEEGDTICVLHAGERYDLLVRADHIRDTSARPNSEVLAAVFGPEYKVIVGAVYGKSHFPLRGDWPVTSDKAALTMLALLLLKNADGVSTEKCMRGGAFNLDKIQQVLSTSNWGCQRSAVVNLVSAIVDHPFHP